MLSSVMGLRWRRREVQPVFKIVPDDVQMQTLYDNLNRALIFKIRNSLWYTGRR